MQLLSDGFVHFTVFIHGIKSVAAEIKQTIVVSSYGSSVSGLLLNATSCTKLCVNT